jgi:hypothetical protein
MRQPTSKREKFLLAGAVALATGTLFLTTAMFIRSRMEKPWPAEIVIEAKACVAGGYEQGNGRYVIDVFIPGVGVDTAEGILKETYDEITEALGVC